MRKPSFDVLQSSVVNQVSIGIVDRTVTTDQELRRFVFYTVFFEEFVESGVGF